MGRVGYEAVASLLTCEFGGSCGGIFAFRHVVSNLEQIWLKILQIFNHMRWRFAKKSKFFRLLLRWRPRMGAERFDKVNVKLLQYQRIILTERNYIISKGLRRLQCKVKA